MKLSAIGFGQAGGNVLDKIVNQETEDESKTVPTPVCVNSAKADLIGLEYIPDDLRVLIGKERVSGHGAGADNELGWKMANENIEKIQEAVEGGQTSDIDAYLILVGLGGGTGGGGAPVLAKHFKHIDNKPVYGIGILPSPEEGSIYNNNAAWSLQKLHRVTDNLLIWDNGKFETEAKSDYEKINVTIAKHTRTFFELPNSNATEGSSIGDTDPSEIRRRLSSGTISSSGFAEKEINDSSDGLVSGLLGGNGDTDPDPSEVADRMADLIEEATVNQLSVKTKLADSTNVIIVFRGPPEHLNQKGIEQSREWLNREAENIDITAVACRIKNTDAVSCAVVLPNVTSTRVNKVLTTDAEIGNDLNILEESGISTDDESDPEGVTDSETELTEEDSDSKFGPQVSFEEDR